MSVLLPRPGPIPPPDTGPSYQLTGRDVEVGDHCARCEQKTAHLPNMGRGSVVCSGSHSLVSQLKFNDSHAEQPPARVAINPRFNQVDRDAECGCVETMISSDQGEGRAHPPPVVSLSREDWPSGC